MNLIPFTDSHIDFMNKWLKERSLEKIDPKTLPMLGYVVEGSVGPVGMAFLRRAEGGWGIIDSLVTDPNAPSEERHLAIELLTETIIGQARQLGMTDILAFSTDYSTLTRSLKHGFVQSDHTLITKKVN